MRPEQHPASNSNARKAHAEATNPHGGCKVGTCKAEDQWRTVSCTGGGGDAKALAEALCKAICDLLGEPRILVPGEVLALLSRPPVGDLLAATLAAQPAAPQPTEDGALIEVDRLHSGLHQCRGGRFYDDDDPGYRGTIATRGPCPTAAAARAGLAARSQHLEAEVCACGYGTVCQACKLADRLAAQRTEGVTLMTEPHDGHAANETCPGCPHAAEVPGDTEAGGDR